MEDEDLQDPSAKTEKKSRILARLKRLVGLNPGDIEPDPREALERATKAWDLAKARREVRQDQYVVFDGELACIVFLSDQHIGGKGVNYPRMIEEAELIRDIPGMFAFFVGDLLDQFIIGQLIRLQMGAAIRPTDEWAIGRLYLEILTEKLLGAIRGNHLDWIKMLVAVDYFAETLRRIAPECIYGMKDCRFTVKMGSFEKRLRVRHRWAGHSQWNPTHGIEKAAKNDGDFDVGVGAHTHLGAMAREFTCHGEEKLALLCGTYKEIDDYPEARGFPLNSKTTAVAVIFDKALDAMIGTRNLRWAAWYMRTMSEHRPPAEIHSLPGGDDPVPEQQDQKESKENQD